MLDDGDGDGGDDGEGEREREREKMWVFASFLKGRRRETREGMTAVFLFLCFRRLRVCVKFVWNERKVRTINDSEGRRRWREGEERAKERERNKGVAF